jgi:hypothetical protein
MVKTVLCIFSRLAVAFLLAALSCAQQPTPAPSTQAEALTNADVMKMVEAKLSDDLIISKIRASACSFDTSTDAILKLKSQGVSDAVIQAMVTAGAPPVQRPTAATPPQDPNNPLSPHTPGIYWLTKNNGGQRLTRLEASSFGGGKTAGMFGMAMSYGLKKAKMKAVLAEAHAPLRIGEPSPEFWFYIEDAAAQGFGRVPLAQASKPEDFLLAKMEVHEKERQLVVTQMSVFGGSSSGPGSKDVIPFQVQKIAPGVFKVTVSKPLGPGEYCFVPPSGMAVATAGGQLYDFGIDATK